MANELTCFFHVLGSYDSPRNMDKNNKFGFIEGDLVNPVFNYTLNDVERSFIKPRIMQRKSIYDHGSVAPELDDISRMIVESYNNDIFLDPQDNLNNEEWSDAFRVLEYLYMHQTTSNLYDGYAHKTYAERDLTDEGGEFHSHRYTENTLVIHMSTLVPGRMKMARFQVIIGGYGCYITVYFTPDDVVELGATREDNYPARTVYEYEDVDDVEGISDEEIRTQILNKLLVIQNENNYHRYDIINVLYRDDNEVESTKYFYIFTLYNSDVDIDPLYLTNSVKLYLNHKHSFDTDDLKYHYPILFALTTVHLLPLLNNRAENGQITSPIDLGTIEEELTARGFNYDPANESYRNTEIFLLYGSTLNTQRPTYVCPILAVEDDESSTQNPISSRYPYLVPVIPGFTTNNSWREFHQLVVIAENIVAGLVPVNKNDSTIDGIPLESNFSIVWVDSDIKEEIDHITFMHKAVTFKMYPPRMQSNT